MTQIHWLNSVSDNFSNAADWSGGVVPGAGDDAILNAPGTKAYTVTSSTAETVSSLQTAANATLLLSRGTFTATMGTGAGVNAGTIRVGAGANLKVGHSVMNTGEITLASPTRGRSHAQMIVAGSTTLDGGGNISLGGVFSVIKGTVANSTLINIDNTISGAGQIGNGAALALTNEAGGVINANISTPNSNLRIFDDQPVTNFGLIEATSGGGLVILNTTVNNAGGMIEAISGGGVTVEGGAVSGGNIFAGAGSNVFLQNGSVSGVILSTDASGGISIDSSSVTTNGVIANDGIVDVAGNASDLIFDNNTSLTGGGTLFIQSPGVVEGASARVVLTNVDNTITGEGELGNGSLTLINQAAGVIVARSGGNPFLTINTGANTVINAGLIESSSALAGSIMIDSPVDNTGTLEAVGETLTVDKKVTGAGSVIINGGTLVFNSGFNERVAFTGTTGVLELAKSVFYHQAITGFSTTAAMSLHLEDIGFVSAAEATFSGTAFKGILTVSDGTHTANIHLRGDDYRGATFTASSDGAGGTIVVATQSATELTPPHAFIATMAGLGGAAGAVTTAARDDNQPHPPLLARPAAMIA